MNSKNTNHCVASLSTIRSGLAAALILLGCAAAQGADYPAIVLQDGPLAYYRLADVPPADVATNSGSLGSAGNGLYIGAGHRAQGALAGDPNAAASFDGTGVRVAVPFTSALNPPAAQPFTIEAWVQPTIDGLSNAQAPIFNRHSPSGANRQGWVFFQRASGTGFNFRMYNENGSAQSVDITGGPYTVGQWTHLVAVWNGATATLYVNGANVGSQTAGYVANTDAPLSIGAYGANNPGDNPYTGSVDEVAFYSSALTAAQITNHYITGLNPAPATNYSSVVLADGAIEYLRLNETSPLTNVAANSGSLGPAGDGIHSPGGVHSVPGALAGVSDSAMRYSAIDTNSDDGGVPTIIPYNPALNASSSFSVEAWLRPTEEGAGNAQCPLFNCQASTEDFGWDFYQRASVAGSGQQGFEFYMNDQTGSRVGDAVGGTYTVGQWCYLAAVYDSSAATATLYINGAQVAQATGVSGYVPNPSYPFSVGGYSDGAQNPFVGDIDEVAIYTNALSAARVLAHYQNGTNASRIVSYDSLVKSDGAAEYLRLDEPARAVVSNSGTLGSAANATYVNTSNTLTGPVPPADAGFETNNLAANFDGTTSYLEMGNPPPLNFHSTITLEAWILPGATQNADAYIIGHGGNDTFTGEVFLRIEGGAYEVGSTNTFATYTVPAGDLGGTNWIHLAGTWDGTNWNLFRNGILVNSTPDAAGPTTVSNANWAVGARGKWKRASGFPFSGEDRVFTGGIDEAAVYNAALSPSRIAQHYSAGAFGRSPLTITFSGGNVILTWAAGTLQQATSAPGPYTDVLSATSPYSVPVASTIGKYFRLRF